MLFRSDGIVIVTSPQELVQMIVKKAYNMAEMMHVPVLGLVENFSYLKCPDCGKEIKLFGESHIDDVAKELGIPVFGKLPLDPAFAEQADRLRTIVGKLHMKNGCVHLLRKNRRRFFRRRQKRQSRTRK